MSQIEDRAERLKVEREAQKRTADLKRANERQVAGRALEPSWRQLQSRGVRVVRDGKVLESVCGHNSGNFRLRKWYTNTLPFRNEGGRDARGPSEGDRVRLKSFGSIGIVDRVKDDEAEVRVGSVRMREKLEQS